MSRNIEIIGDGCAALSFAARAKDVHESNITIIKPNNAPESKDHVWGFWSDKSLKSASELARGTWNKWAVINHEQRIVMESVTKPYNAIKRSDWNEHCLTLAESAGVKFINQSDWQENQANLIYDSRPPIASENNLLQHFHGIEIETESPVFDSETAILMDFRVDQSKGMHFIYLLPYSATKALVESTIFSHSVENKEFYMESINSYLQQYYDIVNYQITHQENGVIPLGKLSQHDPNFPGIGANGGAIRPATGYAFLFIQRQIDLAIKSYQKGKSLIFESPHRRLDLWMDSVMLTVLRHWPELGPKMFIRMSKALTGDQFVKFLSGDAGWWIRLKVIFSMPKFPFIKALTKRVFNNDVPNSTVVA